MSFTELTKLHWLLSNGHFSVISERALVYRERETKRKAVVKPDLNDKIKMVCLKSLLWRHGPPTMLPLS